jgi:hypothetical protein
MTSRCESICITLLSIAKSKQKKYCFVSQRHIEELLEKYHSLCISNRTLNRDLRWLEDNGFISRLRRLRLTREGKFVRDCTLYKFTGKLFNWLYLLGNRVKRFFSFFHLPKMADNQLRRRQASSVPIPALVENAVEKVAPLSFEENQRRMRALIESLE